MNYQSFELLNLTHLEWPELAEMKITGEVK